MTQSNQGGSLARPRPTPIRISAEELGLRELATRFYRARTDTPPGRLMALAGGRQTSTMGHRFYAARQIDKGRSGLELAAREMLALRTLPSALRASEAELRLFPLFLSSIVDRLSCGDSIRSEGELVLEEGRLEAAENRLTDRLLVLGHTPERLMAAADADEREAGILLERARTRRIRARALTRGAA